VYLIVGGGYAMSGFSASGARPAAFPFGLAFIGVVLFFFELRLMDELKDFAKDCSAHPERPLPRGLLSVREVQRAGTVLTLGMLAFAGATALAANPTAGALYLAVTGYLFLMYKEFFAGAWLGARPILYALAHQPVGWLVALFPVALFAPMTVFRRIPVGWGLMAVGGLFAYEICRKLDPAAPAELGYYVQRYGRAATGALLLGCLALASAGAALGGALWYVLPTEAALAAGYLAHLFLPVSFRVVERLASLNLVMALWGTFFARFFSNR
jgi:4-hydroxybenzoate polyprenyltransferase